MSRFLERIRNASSPAKVDAALLVDYGVSQGNVFALLSALKFLNLIDDNGEPTSDFSSLQTMGEEFQGNLEQIIRKAYAELFSRFDLTKDSKEHIRNYFARNYSASQAGKATTLFYGLCSKAGIPTIGEKELGILKARLISEKPKGKIDTTGEEEQKGAEPREKKPEVRGEPHIDIRIHSRDFSSMQPNQIQVFFNGLSKVVGQREKSEEEES